MRLLPLTLVLVIAPVGCVISPGRRADDAPARGGRPQFQEIAPAPGGPPAVRTVESPPRESPPAADPYAVSAGGVVPPGAAEPRSFPPGELFRQTDPAVVAAVRAFLNDRPDVAADALRGLDPAGQEILLRVLPAVVRASRPGAAAGPAAAATAADLSAAAAAAGRAAPLRVAKACFAYEVLQYGQYQPLPDDYRFLPGGPNAAMLYVELANVVSAPVEHPRGGPGYVVTCENALTITDSAGKTVARYDTASAPDLANSVEYTRSPVSDYFLRFTFPVPKAAGTYTVTLDVRDRATGRAVRKAVDFRVGGP